MSVLLLLPASEKMSRGKVRGREEDREKGRDRNPIKIFTGFQRYSDQVKIKRGKGRGRGTEERADT